MKWVNQKYNDHIYDLGRQFNATLYLYNNNASYVGAYSVDVVNYNAYGDMCRTAMQEYSFECDTDLETLDLSNYKKFILKTEIRETGAVGPTSPPLYITEKKYSEDKKTFEYKMCDAMVKTMIPFNWETIIGNVDTTTLYSLIQKILIYVIGSDTNVTYNINNLPSGISDVIIKRNSIDGLSLTCRDVLDMALELCGTSMRIHQNKYGTLPWCIFQCVNPTNATSNYTADEDIIRDDTAYTKQKYGPVNSILFESEIDESDNLERKDDTSIANNGITQYKVLGNFLLDNDNRATAINMLYNRLNGLEYYLCDLRTIGYMALEIYDNITISLNSTNYLCKLTKNIFTLSNGLEETIVSEKPTQTYDTYESGSPYDDKKARIDVDKMKGEIVLKTDSNGTIAQVRLDSSGDDGSVVQIKGTQINLEGTTTINDRFKIDTNGYMYAKAGGEVAGWKISDDALYKYVRIGDYDYMTYIQSPLTTYTEDSWIFSTQKKHKDALGYGGTAIIKLGGDIKGKDISATGNISASGNISALGNITATNNLSVQNKLAGYLNLNDAKTHYLGEYGLYFTDETFTIVGTNEYTRYTHNGFAVNGNGAMSGSLWLQNVYPQSQVEIKKNIKLYDKNALDILKNVDIYNYNFKTEEDKDKKHIGFVIGDDYKYSKEITNNDNSGVDLYSFVSVCCKAIQEQQKEIEELKSQIEKLSKK